MQRLSFITGIHADWLVQSLSQTIKKAENYDGFLCKNLLFWIEKSAKFEGKKTQIQSSSTREDLDWNVNKVTLPLPLPTPSSLLLSWIFGNIKGLLLSNETTTTASLSNRAPPCERKKLLLLSLAVNWDLNRFSSLGVDVCQWHTCPQSRTVEVIIIMFIPHKFKAPLKFYLTKKAIKARTLKADHIVSQFHRILSNYRRFMWLGNLCQMCRGFCKFGSRKLLGGTSLLRSSVLLISRITQVQKGSLREGEKKQVALPWQYFFFPSLEDPTLGNPKSHVFFILCMF